MNVVPMTPITSVKICRNVPLDSTYKDTLDFASVSAQTSYFSGKAKQTFTNLTPVRLQNALRLPVNADSVYDCNYIMFQNANFNQKWFYAFITKINFVNVNMCEISFELDVMQTWMFDYTLKPSFVEREHINNDIIGANLVPENLETGDYVQMGAAYNSITSMPLLIVVATTFDNNGNWAPGQLYNKVYSGLKYYAWEVNDIDALNNFLESVNNAGKADGIVSIFMMPKPFYGTALSPLRLETEKNYTSLKDGYIPRNKKLFIYPYNFINVTNGQGDSADYRYEYFSSNNCIFDYYGDTTPNPTVLFYPIGYKGSGAQNYEEGITMSGYPQCSFNTDVFKAWLAQNASSLAVSTLSSVTQVAGGALTGNAVIATSGIARITDLVGQVYQHDVLPPQARGSSYNGSLNVALDRKEFIVRKMSIQPEFARIIDDYFDMYGYATNEIKIPNVAGRQSWNYVKTIDCKAIGSIPFEDMDKIRSIYDSGITFWHGDWVGDYDRPNGEVINNV